MHRSKQHHYSITLSARAMSVGGISRPSALAVFRAGKGLTMFAHPEMHAATELVDAQALLHRVALIPDENVKAGELARPLRR